jgi:integrase
MRFNEALQLDWRQVDLKALDEDGRAVGEVHLAGAGTKTKRARTVGLEVSPALQALLARLHELTGGRGRVFGFSEGVAEAAAKRLRARFGAPAEFTWQILRRTCGTYLTNAPGVFGAASAYRSAKQLGHSVIVAEKHYLGVVRGIPRTARTLEAALQIEDQVQFVRDSVGRSGVSRAGEP